MPTREEWKAAVASPHPPSAGSPLLIALWNACRGNWDAAHHIVQDLDSGKAAALHAWLHRKEGDDANARYWYHRAGRPASSDSLEDELEALVNEFLA